MVAAARQAQRRDFAAKDVTASGGRDRPCGFKPCAADTVEWHPCCSIMSAGIPLMRLYVICLSTGLAWAGVVGGAADTDVHGSARSAGRPQVNAVVWLEAPTAPHGRQSGRVVLDQKNLTFSPH